MLNPLQFQIVLALLCVIVFVIIYIHKKKFSNFKELIYDSFIDGVTLYSGFIIILFAMGRVFNIGYLNTIDNVLLYFFIIFAGFIILAGILDKIIGERKE